MRDYLEKTCIAEAKNEEIHDMDVLENIIIDYESLLKKAIEIKEMSDEKNEYGTSSLMDNYILEYSKILWMLKQMMK